ncbi:MAG TPA: amidohydrolase family protein [Sphingobium sp.]
MTRHFIPPELEHLAGEILDVDSHEMMPTKEWVPQFGEVAAELQFAWEHNGETNIKNMNHPYAPSYVADDQPIGEDIWKLKGVQAPGAVLPVRREKVMDAIGVKRQIMFPTFGMASMQLATLPLDYGYAPNITKDRRAHGKALLNAYNKWAIKVTQETRRVLPVTPVLADTIHELLATTRALIDGGIRVIELPANILPGGKSPASFELDPFWEMISANNVTVCLHVGIEHQIFAEKGWNEATVFEGFKVFPELKLDPWSLTHLHLPPQNFLATMVQGWVFERFPDLRFGIMEYGAYWVGPLCDSMDLWYAQGGYGLPDNPYARLPRTPSDYVKRNVRVGVFDFEPVDKYITQYGLEDVVCFASDYPHVEGGRDPMGSLVQKLAPLGDHIIRKVFVDNAQWIMGDKA